MKERQLDTAALVDFFEEITAIAFRAGARDQLETLVFAIVAADGSHRPVLVAGVAEGLEVPYEVALERAAAAIAPDLPLAPGALQVALAGALRRHGIRSRALPIEPGPPVGRLILLRDSRGARGPIIEGEWTAG